MYNIIIVDDEAVVREGIRDNMDWDSLGFRVAGCCGNGREAMDAVDRLKPDVVLTDINMPFVDGIELTRYIYEKYPEIRVIILTGFDEFEYAQQAIKLKAYDFLLKPLTAAELGEILTRVRNDLDEDGKKREDLSRLKMQLRESLPLLKERFLNRLVTGTLREGELQDKLKYFNVELRGNCFIVLTVDVDDYGEFGKYHPEAEDELLLFAVSNICEELAGRYPGSIVFQNRSGKNLILVPGGSEDLVRSAALALAEEIRQAVENYLKFTVTIGVGTPCGSPGDIGKSYKSSLSALDYRFVLGKNRVVCISDMEQYNPVDTVSIREWEKKLSLAVKLGNTAEVSGVMEDVILELKNACLPVKKCSVYLQQLIAAICGTLEEAGVEESQVFEDTSPFAEIGSFRTLGEMEKWLLEAGRRAAAAVTDKRSDLSKVQVIKAEEFIKMNHADPNLSLGVVCKHLYISSSYFSLIFKQHTGETFVEYLTRVRMEKASELLKTTPLKTYEISEKVGYGDPHYFSLLFKKTAGLSPTEFREKWLKENPS